MNDVEATAPTVIPATAVERNRALRIVLELGQGAELPEPHTETTTMRGGPALYFHTVADLTEWAIYAEAPIKSEQTGRAHIHKATAVIGDVRVALIAVLFERAGAKS